MQYPIIDTFAQAYINNGWTGADVTIGKNLFNNNVEHGNIGPDGTPTGSSINYVRTINFIEINPNTTYTVSGAVPTDYEQFYTLEYDSNKNLINRISRGYGTITFTTNELSKYLKVFWYVYGRECPLSVCEYVQIEEGSEATSFEPYISPSNDFPHRLKLPLPHYFPHPVIDALQAAAAGTQTAEQTDVLRHYLTPLGIGGI